MKYLFKNRIFLTFFISTFIFTTIYFLSGLGFFERINDGIKGFTINFKNQTYSVDPTKKFINNNVIFVTIDDKTLDVLDYPMSRADYIPVIENLVEAETTIIGFDIFFANNNKFDLAGDDAFAAAIKKANNIVLGGATIPININGKTMVAVKKPLPKFYEGVFGFGYYRPELESSTNRVESFIPSASLYNENGEIEKFNHFSIAILKAYYSKIYNKNYIDFEENNENFYFFKPGSKIPFASNSSKKVLINFIPKPVGNDKLSNFPTYSFLDIYNKQFDPKIFKDKIVIIGATAKSLPDTFTTINGIEYGIFIHGNILNTIFTKNFLRDFPVHLEWILIFLLLLLSVYSNLSRSGYILIFSNISITIIFLIIFPWFTLYLTYYLLGYIFELFLALIFSLAIGNIVKYIIENKNKQKLSKALSEYVSKAIADEILSNSGNVNLDGEKKELSIFFSDIEGFTSVSEKFSPEKLVSFLRDYLGEMSNIILNNEGFINKYEGDAIMALWGTFKTYENSSFLACDTALKQQKSLTILNKTWKEQGFSHIKTRIGIHYGEAIIGNIGAQGRKLEYTALGDNVNLASRLEGVNKFYGTYICTSETVYKQNRENFVFRYLDEIRVKGKEKAVKIYELIDYKENKTKELEKQLQTFEQAITLYKQKKFIEAKKLFEILESSGDAPSKTYKERCQYYIDSPDKNWDGIWNHNQK